MQLLVLARLESPAPASVEGYLAPYSSGVQQHSRFSVSASWSIRVGRGLDEAQSTIRAEFGMKRSRVPAAANWQPTRCMKS